MGELVDNINDMSRKIGESERMKSEFISSVSHELRTPLTAINGWGETLLADESNDVQQIKRGVQIMVKESRRLTNMVEELLQFSRLEDGRFTLQVEDTDLQAELEDAVYSYRELFRQDGIALEYSSDRAEYGEVISGDPERLKQVFCNLLDNAAKHGDSGKRIAVHLSQQEGEYVITIRDFGPGIPEAELPYVKQKFYKGSSKARGSGIGLAVCDEIVQRHGGRLDIANAEGGGTVVTVYLPLKKQAVVRCSNCDKGAETMKVCKVGCIGCGKCVKVCAFDAIKVENNLAYIDPNKCKSCRKCEEVCPQNTIVALNFPPRKPKAEGAAPAAAKVAAAPKATETPKAAEAPKAVETPKVVETLSLIHI